jgi:hypothetical protein
MPYPQRLHQIPVHELECQAGENYLCVASQKVYGFWIIGIPSVAKTDPGADGRETVALPPASKESAMSTGPETSKALRHRREAAACGAFAANAKSAADRELLLRMQRSLLTRAWHEDWLEGLPPPVPPAGCNSLALPARS